MADDASGAKKTPTVLRIKLRYEDLEMFIERFAPNIGRSGLFIRTRTPKPVGSEIRFELRLADDKPVVVGLGVVRWIKDYDARRPRAAHGMGVEFMRVTRESREVLLRVLEFRKRHGMVDGERGLPMPPDDDDAAPRGSGPIADHSAPPRVMDPIGSGPVPEPVEAPALDDFRTGPVAVPKPGPIGIAKAPAVVPAPKPAPVPAPVRASVVEEPLPEPVAAPSPIAAPSALAAEPARRPRPSLESLIASTPAAAADVDDDALIAFLSEGLDVAATIARARTVAALAAGGDADADLDALLAATATPDVSIDDASARLAAMFGTPAPESRKRPSVSFAEGTRETNPTVPAETAEPEPAAVTDPSAGAVTDAGPVTDAGAVTDAVTDAGADADADADADAGADAGAGAGADAAAAAVDDDDDDAPGVGEITRPVAPEILAMALAADITPTTEPIDKVDPDVTRIEFADLDLERTVIADPAALAAAAAASAAADDDGVDSPTILAGPPPGALAHTVARLKPPPRGEFDSEVDVDTLVKAQAARGLPPPPARGKPRTVPPPRVEPEPEPESSPALDVAAAGENSSGSIDITGLVEQLEAEAADPQPLHAEPPRPRRETAGRDERELAAQAMNADELLSGMRDIGRRRPPSGPAPDLASFADPPDNPGAPRPRPPRGSTVDDALAALESLSFDDPAEETAVSRARDVAVRPPSRPPRAPTPPPVDNLANDDDDDISIDIQIDTDDE